MSEKFQNKYRIDSTRLKNYDYSSDGAYFITIVTKNRENFFGEIVDKKIQLSEIGFIVNAEWVKTFDMRPDMNLIMGEYIIMPNHIHAIILIGENHYNLKNDLQNKFGPQSKNLASVIRGFKIGVTKNARLLLADFAWQPLFYDRIIRNETELNKIRKYIIENPDKWEGNRNN